MKPVQTGVERLEDGDIGAVGKLAPGIVALPPELACPYLLKMECSPHLAAEAEGVEIRIDRIQEAVARIDKGFAPDVLLLEGAGGVCVPLTRKLMASRLIAKLDVPTIVVALAGLGTVNHTALTVKELMAENVEVAGVAVNRMPKAPGPIELDNLRAIVECVPVEILAVVEDSPDLSGSGFKSCEGLAALLKG
jgi:dethiobiotin synthase